jgi:hypothetical protein
MKQLAWLLSIAIIVSSCSSADETPEQYEVGEFIYRHHDEFLFTPQLPEKVKLDPYPWDKDLVAHLPKITKEFFRCKGSSLNPERVIEHGDKIVEEQTGIAYPFAMKENSFIQS